ncbi:MAG: sigma-70 family RNA polymerase sigma factor [bacterium]
MREDNKNNGQPKDSELVLNAQKGSRQAFGELVKRYERKIYALTYRIMRNREDAADTLQETFMQAYNKIGTFEGKSGFSTWLYRIAVNTCLMKKRKKKLDTVSIDRPLRMDDGEDINREPVDWSNNPMAAIDNKEVKKKLDEAIAEMPEEFRTVVLLRDVDRLSSREVADILNITVPNMKSRLHRGRLFLRRKLSEYFRSRGEL